MILSDYETAFRVLENFVKYYIMFVIIAFSCLIFFDMISPSFCLCVVIARS